MTGESRIIARSELIIAITAAMRLALDQGMTEGDVAATVTRIVELLQWEA